MSKYKRTPFEEVATFIKTVDAFELFQSTLKTSNQNKSLWYRKSSIPSRRSFGEGEIVK
jgi:hypothetical protein